MPKYNHCSHMVNYMAAKGGRMGKTAVINALFFMYAQLCGLIEFDEEFQA